MTLSGGLAAAATLEATTATWPGNGTWQPDPANYGMTVDQNIPIKMKDGVTLIANVGYPTDPTTGQRASGTFPVLLTQDPYASATQPNSYYVSRGYINAVVEIRGAVDTYGPGGKEIASDFFGPRQTEDSVALVNWAAHKLPGSNGVIGLDGCSFLGTIGSSHWGDGVYPPWSSTEVMLCSARSSSIHLPALQHCGSGNW